MLLGYRIMDMEIRFRRVIPNLEMTVYGKKIIESKGNQLVRKNLI